MTNETNYRTKANAVFFAAIMVVSMVAVGFAAAPAAANASCVETHRCSRRRYRRERCADAQDVTFDVTVDAATSDTIEVNLPKQNERRRFTVAGVGVFQR